MSDYAGQNSPQISSSLTYYEASALEEVTQIPALVLQISISDDGVFQMKTSRMADVFEVAILLKTAAIVVESLVARAMADEKLTH